MVSIHSINHERRWFHKWSSTLSDHQIKNASLTYKSSSVSNGWPMLSHRGRCTTNWYQDQRSYVWYLKKPYIRYKWYKLQVVSFQQSWRCPSKMQDSSLNHQPQTYTFASMRSSPFFMEIDDKGGEIVQRYESLIEWGRD